MNIDMRKVKEEKRTINVATLLYDLEEWFKYMDIYRAYIYEYVAEHVYQCTVGMCIYT